MLECVSICIGCIQIILEREGQAFALEKDNYLLISWIIITLGPRPPRESRTLYWPLGQSNISPAGIIQLIACILSV